jgi:hypothetical protein
MHFILVCMPFDWARAMKIASLSVYGCATSQWIDVSRIRKL